VDDMTDEELDLWFANCVPLSNLPTPPPAKECYGQWLTNTVSGSSIISTTTELYAATLCRLVPSNVCSRAGRTPCPATIARFLERAQPPAEIVAFAACVLDALSLRFASSWREAPEVIPLAAMAIAYGFLADKERSSRYWAQGVAEGMVSVRELEAMKWCLLSDIDYGLMRITEEMVAGMLQRMKGTMNGSNETISEDKKCHRSLDLEPWRGAAVWVHGVHTPEPSP
ncbi:uncharacterized protein EI97DRAFT_364722, partial [Westerdykella ornata]